MPSMNKKSRRTKPRSNGNRKSNYDKSEYHSTDWRYYSKEYRSKHKQCVDCGGKTQMVDHIIPVRIGGDMWDMRNHQSMCNSCHARKSSREGRDIYEISTKNIDGRLIPLKGGKVGNKVP